MPHFKWDQKKPCDSCPYRRDVPIGIWDEVEFNNLKRKDESFMGAVFGCHLNSTRPANEGRPCAGFLLDQKKRNTPSLMLRLALNKEPGAAELYDALSPDGLELYDSIEEMCEANKDQVFPTEAPQAAKLLSKLNRKKR